MTSCIAGQSPDGAFINENVGTEFHQGKQFFTDKEIGISHKKTTMVTKEVGGDTAAVVLSVRAPVGDVNIVRRKICIGRGLFGIVPKESVDVEYLFFAMSALSNFLQKQSSGTTFKAINGKTVREFHFPLPPLSEQHRITTKINRLFEQINRIEESQKELLFLSEKFRQSCLKKATQGGLVPQLESEPSIKLPSSIETNDSLVIPNSWKWVKLKDLFEFVDYRGKTPTKTQKGIRLITASNIKFGYMDHSKKTYISNEEYLMRQSRGLSKKGDVLITTEAPLGNVAIADIENYSAGQRIITLKSKKGDNILYMYFMLSPFFQDLIWSQATGTTAKGIKAARLKELKIPVPPEEEQKRIAGKISILFEKLECLSQLNP